MMLLQNRLLGGSQKAPTATYLGSLTEFITYNETTYAIQGTVQQPRAGLLVAVIHSWAEVPPTDNWVDGVAMPSLAVTSSQPAQAGVCGAPLPAGSHSIQVRYPSGKFNYATANVFLVEDYTAQTPFAYDVSFQGASNSIPLTLTDPCAVLMGGDYLAPYSGTLAPVDASYNTNQTAETTTHQVGGSKEYADSPGVTTFTYTVADDQQFSIYAWR